MGQQQFKTNLFQFDEFRSNVDKRSLPWTKLYSAKNVFIHEGSVRTRWTFTKISINNGWGVNVAIYPKACFFSDASGVFTEFCHRSTTPYSGYIKQGTTVTTISLGVAANAYSQYVNRYEPFGGMLFTNVQNGSNLMKIWNNGSAWVSAENGIPAPVVNPTVTFTVGGSGGPFDDGFHFSVTYSYVNKTTPIVVESNRWSGFKDVTVSGSGATTGRNMILSSLGANPDSANITHIRIYYASDGGAGTGPFYFFEDIAYATSVTTSSTTRDTARQPPVNNNQFATGSTVTDLFVYKQRMFYLTLRELWWSIDNEPEHIPATNLRYLGSKTDFNMKAIVYDSFVVIFKLYSVYILSGDDETNFKVERVLDMGLSCNGPTPIFHSAYKFNDEIFFASGSALYRWTPGSDPQRISDPLFLDGFDVTSVGNGFSYQNTWVYDSVFNKLWYCYYDGGSDTYTKAWVFDPETNKWVGKLEFSAYQTLLNWDNSIYGIQVNNSYLHTYQYYLSSLVGETFDASFETGGRIDDNPIATKLSRQVNLHYKYNSAAVGVWTPTLIRAEGSNATLSTFTMATLTTPRYGLNGGDKSVGFKFEATGLKESAIFHGLTVEYELIGIWGN